MRSPPTFDMLSLPLLCIYMYEFTISRFTPPIQNAFYPADVTRKLLDFVGDQLNNQLTNVGEFMPTSTPPIAGNLIPIRIITSGGELYIHWNPSEIV